MNTENNYMNSRSAKSSDPRRGAVAPFLAVMSVPLVGMIAFSIDYGYLKNVECELQRAADASALAAVMELIPADDGTQSADQVRATVKAYVQQNLANSPAGDNTFTVLDADIEIGCYEETSINGTAPVTFKNTGQWDTVRVTLRRDASANGNVNLFFARVLGSDSKPVTATATAVLRRAQAPKSGADILPFALPVNFWDSLAEGEQLSIYNDNKIRDADLNEVTVLDNDGNSVPGNWGTVDIGFDNNATEDLEYQILYGLTQDNLDAMVLSGRIPNASELATPVTLDADPGISLGIKDEVQAIYGQSRIIPLYDYVAGDLNATGGGDTAQFHVVAWGVVKIVNSFWVGNKETSIVALKAYTYDGALVPLENLTNKETVLKNIFTSPVLVR